MKNDSEPSRRTFLAVLPALTAGLAAPHAQAAQKNAPHWGMLIDTRRCIGCQACTMACAIENALPEGQFRTFAATYAVTARDGRGDRSIRQRKLVQNACSKVIRQS